MSYVLLVPKKFKVNILLKKILEHFYSTKRFVLEFQGEYLGLFLSYLAHFRRYHHFKGFWLSTASWYRDC